MLPLFPTLLLPNRLFLISRISPSLFTTIPFPTVSHFYISHSSISQSCSELPRSPLLHSHSTLSCILIIFYSSIFHSPHLPFLHSPRLHFPLLNLPLHQFPLLSSLVLNFSAPLPPTSHSSIFFTPRFPHSSPILPLPPLLSPFSHMERE